jgi:hypothetical protein
MIVIPLKSFRRDHPIRRLSRSDCDRLGYQGPLVLSVRQARWLLGPWRSTNRYVVVRHPNQVVMECSRAELLQLGVTLDDEPVGA